MSYNFDRKYQLLIGYPEQYYLINEEEVIEDVTNTNVLTGIEPVDSSFESPNFLAVPSGDQGTLIEDLKLTCSVQGTVESSGNDSRKCVIKVYNMSPSTRAKISKKNCKVILKAGYKKDYIKDNLPIVVSGQISRVKTKRQEASLVTEIEVVDGFVPKTSVKVKKSIKPNFVNPITARDVLSEISSIWAENGIASTEETIVYDFPLQSTLFYAGWSGEGYLADITTNFCESLGLEWYITNSKLYVQPKGYQKIKELFSLNSSLLKNLEAVDNEKDPASNTKSAARVSITTFLDGRISEGKYLELVNPTSLPDYKRSYIGKYKVLSVSHNMDSERGVWDTVCECEKLK